MSKKAALFAVSLIALAVLVIAPVDDLAAEGEEDVMLLADAAPEEVAMIAESEDDGGNNLFYDGVLALVIALALLGLLHVVDRARKANQ